MKVQGKFIFNAIQILPDNLQRVKKFVEKESGFKVDVKRVFDNKINIFDVDYDHIILTFNIGDFLVSMDGIYRYSGDVFERTFNIVHI